VVKAALIITLLGALALGPPAQANAPALISIAPLGLLPTATFSLPKASVAFIILSASPAQGTDGSFLQQDVVSSDELTPAEIQSGQWLSTQPVEPGTYYAILQASADPDQCTLGDASIDPSCANGYSNVMRLVVPVPATRYVGSAFIQRFAGSFTVVLTAKPLGKKQAYKVCYRTRAGSKRCLVGTLEGTDWTDAAGVAARITASNQGLSVSTTFTWYVGGRAVTRRRAFG
jgi:hypothetical protein